MRNGGQVLVTVDQIRLEIEGGQHIEPEGFRRDVLPSQLNQIPVEVAPGKRADWTWPLTKVAIALVGLRGGVPKEKIRGVAIDQLGHEYTSQALMVDVGELFASEHPIPND